MSYRLFSFPFDAALVQMSTRRAFPMDRSPIHWFRDAKVAVVVVVVFAKLKGVFVRGSLSFRLADSGL